MAPLEAHRDGVVVRVRARAGARRNGAAGLHDGTLRIDVTAAPEKGKANQAIMAQLANIFDMPKSAVSLMAGASSSQKRFLLAGLELAAAEKWLSAALNGYF